MVAPFALAACAVALAAVVVVAAVARRRRVRDAWAGARARKAAFLERAGEAYGYAASPGGHIDTWRWRELPTLVRPIVWWRRGRYVGEAYLDYAGAALATETQSRAAAAAGQGLGNPHAAGGPAADRAAAACGTARAAVARHLGCDADWGVVWTAGATAAIKLVGDLFPFGGDENGDALTYFHGVDAHTSAVGLRFAAARCGAKVRVVDDWATFDGFAPGLAAVTLESNFDGATARNAADLVRRARARGCATLVDASKAAATGVVDVKALGDPDFVVLSLYKLFGVPTGLGCLAGRRPALERLRTAKARGDRFLGGGTVDRLCARTGFFRLKGSSTDSLEDGTVHFRGIAAVPIGFAELDRVGGMRSIRGHATSLADELRRRLNSLQRRGGAPAAVVYGSGDGPTVAFNVFGADGNLESPAAVCRLAAAAGIQLRHGCFCNPGACAAALGLSPEDVRAAAESGRACGGDEDVDDSGRVLGALRASLGKDSAFEDVDALCVFLAERARADDAAAAARSSRTPAQGDGGDRRIDALFVYPIKSCRGVAVAAWPLLADGRLALDRDFVIVDGDRSPLRPRAHPRLGLLVPSIDAAQRTLTIRRSDVLDDAVHVALDGAATTDADDVSICGSACGGCVGGFSAADAWLSRVLRSPCRLARRGAGGFANEAPLLLVSAEAVGGLDAALAGAGASRVTAAHFRPNLVVSAVSERGSGSGGGGDHPEDDWAAITVGGRRLRVAGPCARCATVELDPRSGLADRGARTLRTLASYRRVKGAIRFGVFLAPSPGDEPSTVAVGDVLAPETRREKGVQVGVL